MAQVCKHVLQYTHPNKPEFIMQKVKVGDVIKSLDFIGNDTCYMIGKVVEILQDEDLYRCKAIVQVWEGKAEIVTDNRNFTVSREGYDFMDNQFPGRITVIA
jgi:hypothetical protein